MDCRIVNICFRYIGAFPVDAFEHAFFYEGIDSGTDHVPAHMELLGEFPFRGNRRTVRIGLVLNFFSYPIRNFQCFSFYIHGIPLSARYFPEYGR